MGAAGAPVRVDISKLDYGAQIVVEWRGKPVYVVKRSSEVISNLETYGSDILRVRTLSSPRSLIMYREIQEPCLEKKRF